MENKMLDPWIHYNKPGHTNQINFFKIDVFVYLEQTKSKRNYEEVNDELFLNKFSLPHFGCQDDSLKFEA